MLCLTAVAMAQPAGGFGGVQQQTKLETSQEWKDINYVGDDQTYHTCDIYLPKNKEGWTDYRTGKHYAGGQTITTPVDKAHIPVFVKQGDNSYFP